MNNFERSAVALICNLAWRVGMWRGGLVNDLTYSCTTLVDDGLKRWFRVGQLSMNGIDVWKDSERSWKVWNEGQLQTHQVTLKSARDNYITIRMEGLGTDYVKGNVNGTSFTVEFEGNYIAKVTDNDEGCGLFKYEIKNG